MSVASVSTQGELFVLLHKLQARLQDWRPVWALLEAKLPGIQEAYWDARFYRGLTHGPGTITARRRGLGARVPRAARQRRRFGLGGDYYLKNRPGPRAKADAPYYEWTGSIRRATQSATMREAAHMAIEADKAYRGPIRASNPVSLVLEEGANKVLAWDSNAIEAVMDDLIDLWIENTVLPGLK